jgi:poly(hydroxyalkanoate) depolymerase family esterase
MARATALTRAGRLGEATALIQQMLGAGGAQAVPPPPREPLGATLRRIARGGMPEGGTRAPPRTDGRMTSNCYRGPAGTRDYLLCVPDAPPPGLMPVVVMLHGCTQTPQDFAAGTGMNALAQARGMIVVWPAQSGGANMNRCWNWFRPEDQARDRGEPAILAAIVAQVIATQAADPARVYVAGLSAGGAAAATLAQAYPDVFAAVGVHSGLAAGAARDVAGAFAAMRGGAPGQVPARRLPTIVFHGTADTTVAVANAPNVARQGLTGQPKVAEGTAPGGRRYRQTALMGPDGRSLGEVWLIDGAGHAWSGGSAAGSYTDPQGPDAAAEMLRFFAQHRLG